MKKLITFIIILLFATSAFAGRNLDNPKYLVGNWKLNSNVDDYSGHGNNGTAINLTYGVNEKGLSCGEFNGSNSQVSIGDIGEDFISCSLWFKPNYTIRVSSPAQVLLNFRERDSSNYFHLATGGATSLLSNELISILDKDNNVQYRSGYCSSSNVVKPIPHHLAVVYTGDAHNFAIYLNGKRVDNGYSGANAPLNIVNNLCIGIRSDNTQAFDGQIWGVKFFNIKLTGDEVKRLYNESTPKQAKVNQPISQRTPYQNGNLVGAWGFNNGLGFKDSSGQGNDGTSIDMVLTKKGGFKGNGSSSSIAVGTSSDYNFSYNSDYTINAKVTPTDFSSQSTIFQHRSGDGYSFQVETSGVIRFWIYDNGWKVVDSDAGIDLNKTTYLTAKYSNNTMMIYVDGVLQADTKVAVTSYSNAGTNAIGSSSNLGGSYMEGLIEELQIHSPGLTSEEIKMLYNQGVPDDSLVLSVLDGTEDLSRYKHTLTNTDTITGNRMKFNGSSSKLVSDLTIDVSEQYTFSWWTNSDSYAGANTWIGGSAINCIQIRNSALNIQVLDGGSGSDSLATTSSPLVADKWQNIVVVWDGTNSNGKIYVDGELEVSAAIQPGTYTDTALYIGASYNGQYLTGKMDNTKVFTGLKSADWVKQNYNQTKGQY